MNRGQPVTPREARGWPTKGCSKRRAKVDCHECLGLRADLKKAIDAIEARLNKR